MMRAGFSVKEKPALFCWVTARSWAGKGATGGAADINKDGRVDIFDLSILLTNWTG